MPLPHAFRSILETIPVIFGLASAICAQVANDECHGAAPLSPGSNGPYTFTLATSSTPPLCSRPNLNDLWFQFRATGDGWVRFEVRAGTGAVSVFAEVLRGGCSSPRPAWCGGGLIQPMVGGLRVSSGEELLVRVGNPVSASPQSFFIDIEESATAINDECSNAIALTPGLSPLFHSTDSTLSRPWNCGGATSDVWFSYTAPSEVWADVTVCGEAGFVPIFGAFDGDCTSMTSRVCGRGRCSGPAPHALRVHAGRVLWIRVGGEQGTQGPFRIRLIETPAAVNDECTQAIPLRPGRNGTFTNERASLSQPWNNEVFSDVWFSFLPSLDGEAIFRVCPDVGTSSFWFEYFDGPCTGLVSRANVLPSCALGFQGRANVRAGRPFFFRIGFTTTMTGTFDIEASEHASLPNDEPSGAIQVLEGPTGPIHLRGSSMSPLPSRCWPATRDIWFRYTPLLASSWTIFETCNASGLPTTLEVYDGPESQLVLRECAIPNCTTGGGGANVAVQSSAGSDLYLRVLCSDRYSLADSYLWVSERRRFAQTTLPTGCGGLTLTMTGNPLPGRVVEFRANGGIPSEWLLVFGAPIQPPLPFCPQRPCALGAEPWFMSRGSVAVLIVPYDPWLSGTAVAVQGLWYGYGPTDCSQAWSRPVPTDTIITIFP